MTSMKTLLALLISLGVLAAAGTAEAAKETGVVILAEGPDAASARLEIADNLDDGYVVLEPSLFTTALAHAGQHGSLGTALATPKKRAALWDRMTAASKSAPADDVVVVVTYRTRSGRKTSTVYVWDAATGASSEMHPGVATADHALSDAVDQQLTVFHPAPVTPPPPVAPALTQAPAPALGPALAAESSPPGSDRASTSEAQRPMHLVGREWLDVSAGLEGGMRHFAYNEGLSTNLRPYQLNAAPLFAFDASLYPLTSSGIVPLSDIGIVGGYARAFAVQSAATDASSIGTNWQRYYVGGHVRIRTAKSPRAVVLGVTGAYGGESFTFDSSASTYPSVSYQFVSAEADVRVPIGRFAVTGGGGYLFVLSAGDVSERFPQSSVGGIDANLGGAFTIIPGLEARLNVSYRRFFYSMNPVPGDSYVAGGALDEFWGLSGSLAYVY
jgi:hypothetical protein